MKARRIEAAIVDLDGTLVDTLGDFEIALNLTLAEFALSPVDRAFIAETVGRGSEHLLRTTLAQVGGDAALYDAAWAHCQRHYRAVNGQHAPVYAGARAGLERLRAAGLVLVSYGYNHGEPVAHAGADALVERIDAIDLDAFNAGPQARRVGAQVGA